MKLTIEVLLLLFVVTIFSPYISYVCHAELSNTETVLEQDIKADKVPLKTNDHTVQDEEIAISDEGFSVAERKNLSGEDHRFQAEINQLMKIIINSLYSNRDIFVRELISNSADALSKVRFLGLTDKNALGNTPNLEIKIKVDKENNQLHFRDTGIGMTKQELISNLGSIAKSGTKEFLDKVKSAGVNDITTIGQFGVGFYSSFLVADKVTVTSKHNDDDQYVWESSASDSASFTVAKDPRGNTLGRGTLVTLHLKDDASKYLDVDSLKDLILKFNEFISYPIYVWGSKDVSREEPVEEDEKEKPVDEKAEDDLSVEENEEEEDEDKPKTKTVTETVWDWERVNVNPPLWTRSRSSLSDEDYLNFYKDVLKDTEEPLYYTHFKAEGDAEFTSLLYIPKSLPAGFFESKFKPAMKFYVKRVFITDNFEDMLPSYLSFMKGVVDSDDLPLNVSREMLQQNKTLAVIKKKLVRKIIAMFQELVDKPEKFEQFYKTYSTNLKLGVVQDTNNRTRLSKLLRFNTAKNPSKQISFEDYISQFKKGQEEIYYLGGENLESVKNSPHLERLTKRGYNVLLLTDPIDEYAISLLGKYDGKYKLTDISKEGFKLSGDDEDKQKELSKEFEPLTEYLKKTLSEKVSKVEVSSRLTKTPAAILSSSWGYSANMERIMKAQALRDERYLSRLGGKRVMEINPRHPIIKQLLQLVVEEKTDSTTEDISNLLYDSGVLNSGFALDEPKDLTYRITKLVATSLNLDPNQVVEDDEAEYEETQDENKETQHDHQENNENKEEENQEDEHQEL